MDYSKLSDFEINCLVAEATGHKPFDAEMGYQGTQEPGDITAAIVRGPRWIGGFDPCNSPANAWPIIVEHRLYIDPIYVSDWSVSSECDSFREIHKNPLRAAMIVFLIMQDSANVPANSTGSDIR